MSLPTRKIGQTEVSAIGYGAMGISGIYGQVTQSDEERFKVRHLHFSYDNVRADQKLGSGRGLCWRLPIHRHRGRVSGQRGSYWAMVRLFTDLLCGQFIYYLIYVGSSVPESVTRSSWRPSSGSGLLLIS